MLLSASHIWWWFYAKKEIKAIDTSLLKLNIFSCTINFFEDNDESNIKILDLSFSLMIYF